MPNKKDKWPSIKDHKTPKKTDVKYDKHMGIFAPTVKQAKLPGQRKGYNV